MAAWACDWVSAMAALAAAILSSTIFSTPAKAFSVRPNRVSKLAFWAAIICSAVIMAISFKVVKRFTSYCVLSCCAAA